MTSCPLIVLTGPSAVGKSTAASELQAVLPFPSLILDSDVVLAAYTFGRGAPAGMPEPRLVDGYVDAICAFLDDDVPVIAVQIFWNRVDLARYAARFAQYRSYLVMLTTSQAVATERQSRRGRGDAVGASFALDWRLPADVSIDTTSAAPAQIADRIAAAIQSSDPPTGFRLLAAKAPDI